MPTIILEVLDSTKVIPLLQYALEREISYMETGIMKTRKRIKELEQKYGGPLDKFRPAGPSIDPLDLVEWEGEAEMLRRLEAEKELLRTVHICG